MTAAIGLYQRLGLPEPWHPTKEKTALIVYGAAGAVVSLYNLSKINIIV
jgi:NADPH2:quinone reductase